MPPQRFNQALLAELLFRTVERFGDAVGVERERVSWKQAPFANRAIPFLEESQHGARGIEPLQSVIAPEKKSAKMPAIGVAQASRSIVIFGEEEGRISAIGRILVKKLVHGAQKTLRLIESDRALAAQIRLQIGHQKGGGDSLSGDIADHQSKPLAAQIQKVVIVAAHLASLNADAGVLEGGERRERLGK